MKNKTVEKNDHSGLVMVVKNDRLDSANYMLTAEFYWLKKTADSPMPQIG